MRRMQRLRRGNERREEADFTTGEKRETRQKTEKAKRSYKNGSAKSARGFLRQKFDFLSASNVYVSGNPTLFAFPRLLLSARARRKNCKCLRHATFKRPFLFAARFKKGIEIKLQKPFEGEGTPAGLFTERREKLSPLFLRMLNSDHPAPL